MAFELIEPGCTFTITDSSLAREGQIDKLHIRSFAPDARVNLNGGKKHGEILLRQ